MPGTLTRIAPSPKERAAAAFDDETIARAAQAFRTDGVLIVDDIVDVALVAQARTAFLDRYSAYLTNQDRADALKVGEGRSMITVTVEPPFSDPRLIANPWLLSILSAVLAPDLVLDAFGVVCSLPGADAQRAHRDGGVLFAGSGLDAMLPAAAVTVALPLLEMNDVHGTTNVSPGSHRDPNAGEPSVGPVVREGSVVFWDFRVSHAGTPNRSQLARPLLYLTCCRPWFFDHRNYGRPGQVQAHLLASEASLTAMSDRERRLLSRAQVIP